MNKVIICGHLGRDPELRHTKYGTAVANLSVATTDRRKQGDDWVEETEWHRVTVWGTQGENCATHLAKGRRVLIEGKIKTSSYEKNGEKRYSTEIVAHYVEFLGGRDGGGGGGQGRSGGQRQRRQDPPEPYDPGGYDPGPVKDDDIPF